MIFTVSLDRNACTSVPSMPPVFHSSRLQGRGCPVRPRDLDKFQFTKGSSPEARAWLWTLSYVAAPIGVALAFVEQMRSSGADPPRLALLPTCFRAVLAAESAAILFVSPWFLFGSVPAWWPWTLTPLVAHAMGAWLLGLGLVLALCVVSNGIALQMLRTGYKLRG